MMADKLMVEKHVEFIKNLNKDQDEMEYWLTEHLRVSGIYWGLVGLYVLGREAELDKERVIEYVLSCQNQDGGFGGHKNHDSHLLYTMSAVQILAMYDSLNLVDPDLILKYVASLQDPETGYISGDKWGEKDTRFTFIAVALVKFLKGDPDVIRSEPILEYIQSAMNYDGGFGSSPGGESHAAQVYTCLAALAILGRLDLVDREKLSVWLSERQLESNGGLNGRPQKLPDVCYSWWVVSSLEILGRRHWIDGQRLGAFILSAQDENRGGMADRPGNITDVYHTCFGLCGLSLVGYSAGGTLVEVDPVYCMPRFVIERMGLGTGPGGWRDYRPKGW